VQVKYIVGYSIPHVDRLQDIVYNLIARAHHFRWLEFAMGLSWIVILVLIKTAPRMHKCVAPSQPALSVSPLRLTMLMMSTSRRTQSHEDLRAYTESVCSNYCAA
jgi:hypothetical protein